MIVRLVGTSGAGKSTIVHQLMRARDVDRSVVRRVGRRHPVGYLLHRGQAPSLYVMGHYEIANGGVDTLDDHLDEIYDDAARWHESGSSVLMEGKNMSDGARRTIELSRRGLPITVVALTTPVDECVRGVRERGHRIAERSIVKTALKVARACAQMRDAGVPVIECSRARAADEVRRLIQW